VGTFQNQSGCVTVALRLAGALQLRSEALNLTTIKLWGARNSLSATHGCTMTQTDF
jgi:hypothetical protein